MDWEKEMEVAGRAAGEAGRILRAMFGRAGRIMKKGEIDLVTEADLHSEKVILEIIAEAFPGDTVVTEEAGVQERFSERVWLIDPLDGTTNFAHSFPFFAVSIALEVEKETVLGLVYNPWLEERFEAGRDAGALLNSEPIGVSGISLLGDALVATGFPYDIHQNPDRVIDLFRRMVVRAQGVRRPGAAAIDLCYVAAGRLDGFWEQGLKPWDTAAGALIVKEAGGVLSTFEGQSYSPYEKSIVASNGLIHQEIVDALAG
ncbi:MAG: inositol monophosphatase [Deltaproteobacteria bacterium]|nr:inositol monophosphatase [Deltaproteobacteria bacterium]